MKAERYNVRWERSELVLALYLYCQIPFAKTKANNPAVIDLANRLGRTPSSVARKLGNFGAFDPLLAKRGISGLTHYSRADEQVWREFDGRWDALVEASVSLLNGDDLPIADGAESDSVDVSARKGIDRSAVAKRRVGQRFFRRTVLASYRHTCCVCALDIPRLLIGSHIVPWSVDEAQRVNPANGLSLCALHDKAFDSGLLTVLPTYEVRVSRRVVDSKSSFVQTALRAFDGVRIQLPQRFGPRPESLAWHNAAHGFGA